MSMMKYLFLVSIFCSSWQLLPAQTFSDAIAAKDTVKALEWIKNGADVNQPDNNGSSALMTACRWGDEPMVVFLLNHGANADKPRSAKGRTPLIVASAYYSGKGICSRLVLKGADVNAAAADGTTALMLAAQNAKLDVVELLLKAGADPKKKDNKGQTALDYAKAAKVDEYLKNSVKDCQIDQPGVIGMLTKADR